MGRIKGTIIKRSSRELIKVHSEKFSTDFSHNKLAVSDSVPGIQKKMRNSIAGYISRLVVRAQKQKKE